MKKLITASIQQAVDTLMFLHRKDSVQSIYQAAEMIAKAFRRGNKILIAGNGGSLCEAMHFSEELTGFFRGRRRALPAMALADPGHLTCVGNDMSFADVFSRGVEAYGLPGDLFIALTTSGNSENICRAVGMALEKGLQTIAFLGRDGGKLKGVCDVELIVPGDFSDRIQEAHLTAIHIVIEVVERELFPSQVTKEKDGVVEDLLLA